MWLHAAHQVSLSFTNSWSLLKLMSIELLLPSNHLIPCQSLLLLPSIFPTIQGFLNELALHIRWTNTGAPASASVLPMHSQFWFSLGFDLLAVQGTLKSFLQHQSSKASILWCSPYFMVQLSHPYITTGKTIALSIQTFVGKVTSLLFNIYLGLS